MELLLSILSSSFIFLLFKVFPKFQIDTFQAVVANYFTAFLCGLILFHDSFHFQPMVQAIPQAILCGFLFISLFVIMGLSSQKNGVSTTSVAVKMSMALSVVLLFILGKEPFKLSDFLCLILALAGVYLVSTSQEKSQAKNIIWMLIILFLGSAALDVVLFSINAFYLPKAINEGVFSSLGFLMAGVAGILYFLYLLIRKEKSFHSRSWLAGMALGIPNYFSIFLLIKSYSVIPLSAPQVLSIANIGVVVLSSLLGLWVFKESFSTKKYIGLGLCLSGLLLMLLK